MLSAVHGTERGLAPETRAGRLLVFGDVPVSQPIVFTVVPGTQLLVHREMPPGHLGVMLDVPTFDFGMVSHMPAVLIHDDLLARKRTATSTLHINHPVS